MIRFLLIAFNVAVITFLIFSMITVVREPVERSKKVILIVGGLFLLLAPCGIFFGVFNPTAQYFIIYPVAIAMFLYLLRKM